MATDTARVQLELASGRNEITAPFYQTAQRRRKQLEQDAASVDAPGSTPTMVDVPLANAPRALAMPYPDPEVSKDRRNSRTPWLAFAAALVAVAMGVWWVMAQRMPDIDPHDVIARNLDDAQAAMADGRYTDPPERSAFHYYSTVLALDPANTDAIAGIDAIADRHLTNARVLLADKRIAEAGVALEKARRVRPEHTGLSVLDMQWRAELRNLLAAATSIAKPVPEVLPKPAPAKVRAALPKTQSHAATGPDVKALPVPQPTVANVAAVANATLAATSPQSVAPTVTESQPVLNSEANVAEESAAAVSTPLPAPAVALAPALEPKLVKMVQPKYPQEALMRGIEGWVDVSLQVSPSGDVVAPRVEDTSRGRMFNRAALDAVEEWKYEPRSDGTTSERVRVRVKFQHSN